GKKRVDDYQAVAAENGEQVSFKRASPKLARMPCRHRQTAKLIRVFGMADEAKKVFDLAGYPGIDYDISDRYTVRNISGAILAPYGVADFIDESGNGNLFEIMVFRRNPENWHGRGSHVCQHF